MLIFPTIQSFPGNFRVQKGILMYRSLILILVSVLVCAPGVFAQKADRGSIRGALPAWENRVIPHITHGATWQSTLIISNVSTTSSFYRVKFYKPDGTPALFKTKTMGDVAELSGSLNAGGSTRVASIEDTSPEETRYWAEVVEGSGKIQVTVLFGWRVPGNTPMDVTVPNVDAYSTSGQYFPFDNTGGYKTAFAFANGYEGINSSFRLIARNEAGNTIFTTTINLNAKNQIAKLLPDEYPELKDQKGMIVLKPVVGAPSNLVRCGPLVLQFHPSGSVTFIPAYDEF